MRRSVLGGLTLALAVSLTACGDDGEAAPSPASSPPGSQTPASTESPSDDPTAEPTADPTASQSSGDTFAGIAPADGPEVSTDLAVINAPAGWSDDPLITARDAITTGPDGDLSYSVQIAADATVSPDTLAELVQGVRKFGTFEKMEVLPEVTIDGIPAYHVSGPDSAIGLFVDEFGFNDSERSIIIRIATPKKLAQADRDAIIGPVLASYRPVG